MKLLIFFLLRGTVTFILTFVIFSLLRTYFFKSLKKHSNSKREFILSLFAGYVAVMCLFLFMPNAFLAHKGIDLSSENFDFVGDFKDRISQGNWGVNLVPFKTIRSYIRYSGFFHSFTNIFGNILIFIPMGFMIPVLYKDMRDLKKILIFLSLISILIETVQFFVGRSVDIDDFILNVLGGSIGYLIYKLRSKSI
ncbi:VanZ family protein [Peptoniphilus catoniae]|uniref:VanZ family protein n=1 Tax=Peptoniphilus catoniae TaxID=1660341 RepID=UPI0010FD1BE4|nr:VanZ family protein [Peptoniphilus catoniae]